ncbi:G-type lectin S-receptor-like serine/threonine-protein kinase LECRK3 [Phoenix dactylifera]|uniref:Receptor-like serine/threonine-protein kinase n=1 Tax=Phoenix dactylifera TaxID=42345 RepID=A0A8B9AUE4_PHODC|nr:G-type lectin S-receptor-like serine/threonine-protein kinase LECRK3 [Phoenix dactylifera]
MMASLFLSPLLAFLIVASPAMVIGQPKQTNITLGSSLPASIDASWLSPSGRFAFGFYPKAQGFAVGVWLATTPERTVVWTANRDDPPIMDGSIRLTFDGRLVWSAPGGQEKVISRPTEPAAMAAMLDTGNFVLYNSQQVIVWSTFISPTDTLLPGQSLLPETQLFSSKSETDRSTGRYRLNNQKDGNLVLYPADTSDTADDAYWDTGTFQIGFLLTLNLDSNGTMYLAGDNGTFTKSLAQAKNSSSRSGVDIYYRVTVDPDGILRLYSHGFGRNGSSTTVVEWAALDNQCLVRGVCGINSYCSLRSNGEPNCLCPPGFEFVNPSRILLGCMRNSSIGDCSENSSGANTGLTMVAVRNTTWVDKPYSILPSTTSIDDCEAACLADCFCEAVLFKDNACTKQMIPLRYGRTGSNDTLFIKVGAINPNQRVAIYQRSRKVRIDVLVISVVLAASSAVVFGVAGFLFCRNRKLGRYTRASECNNSGFDDETPLRSYSYEELERATESFREELGRGAFGTVFKGALSNGERIIAVKRLEKLVEDGEREFQREVRAIGRTHHRNLVRLLGFCNEGSNRLLIYEYVSNGSLANLLFKSETYPSWEERARVALDVARGLQYLHEELEAPIIHCDIKPQNILMDSSGTAKIADFGLAKLLMPDQTRTFTGVRGTRGYLAPEWYKNAPITVKADVYSYGIVLFELICCKRNMELEEAGHDCTLSEWVYECFMAGEMDNLKIHGVVDDGELERMVKVGLWCVQKEPVFRPSMKNVILMLDGNMKVSLPPPPPSFSV